MQLSENGLKVFDARYALKDESGQVIETFAEAVRRIAGAAAKAEQKERKKWEKKFVDAIGNLYFVPATPIWANMGKPDRPWQPGSCFVLDVADDLAAMYDALKDTALVFKSGGGVGYNLSGIRPRGTLVRSTKGLASGVLELIRLYDASANMVMQGGVRRGASIAVLNVSHPEIVDFIDAKLDGSLTNFNLSVGITDEFMRALEAGDVWRMSFDAPSGLVEREMPARELWDKIITAAHTCGDPGLIFLDRLQEANPIRGKVLNAVNPCGELPLFPNESCLLGSINLARMVPAGEVDWALLRDVVRTAVRFLDDIIDVAEYPLEVIEKATKATRKIGLGYTGLHDLLIALNLPYDSPEGRETAGGVAAFIQKEAHTCSAELAEEKGCFPDWENSVYYPAQPCRNAACIAVAPTGSVTVMAGCESYGIEPIFAVAYTKKTNVAGEFEVFSPLFLAACADRGVSKEVLSEVARRGTCQGVSGVPDEVRRVFKGAQDIAFEDHILMQAQVQKYVDSGVSKTINLPNSATTEDVEKSYRMAHDLKLKGMTIFRDGCKEGTVTVGQGSKGERTSRELQRGEILPRPVAAHGLTHRLDTGCGKIYLTVNYRPDTGEILETFITTGSDGGCQVYTEATSRLISLSIRGGISVDEVVGQLQSTHSCPSYQLARGRGKKVSEGMSCASAIARKLKEIKEQLNGGAKEAPVQAWVQCDMCGNPMDRAEGCYVCRECGYSRC